MPSGMARSRIPVVGCTKYDLVLPYILKPLNGLFLFFKDVYKKYEVSFLI